MITSAIDIASGLWGLAFKVFIIIMPLMVLLEWARAQRWFMHAVDSTGRFFSPIGFRPQSLFPLVTGILFGISYGAGVLIPQAQSGELSRKQIFLIAAFLGLCHAVVEDTLLFVALGANAFVLICTRVTAAILVVWLLSRAAWPSSTEEPVAEAIPDA